MGESCYLCSHKLAEIGRLQGYGIYRCRRCALFQLRPVEKTRNITKPATDEFETVDLERYFKALAPERRATAFSILKTVSKRGISSDRVLDIGCSFGWFLDVAKENGWETYGIEPSRIAVAHSSKSHFVKAGIFPDVSFEGMQFDLITMLDVLEHLSEPLQILRNVKNLLSPKGVLVIQIPVQDGLFFRTAYLPFRLSGARISTPLARLFQIQFPYPHLFYFSRANLKLLLDKADYRILHREGHGLMEPRHICHRLYYAQGGHYSFLLRWATYGLAWLANLVPFRDMEIIYCYPK